MTGALLVTAGLMIVAAGACALLLRKPSRPAPAAADRRDDVNDTVMFVPIGPADGDVVRVEGRVVVVDRPVRAPSGRPCVLYELYGGADGDPARALRQRSVAFYVDDGAAAVRIDPETRVVALELPTDDLDGAIERRLEPGARVQVVGQLRRFGAPGHEELTLHPAPGADAVALHFVAVRVSLASSRQSAAQAR